MSQVSADNDDAVPVARSYDAYPFETLHPLLLPVNCSDAGTCAVVLPPHSGSAPAMHYILQQFSPPAISTAQTSARLLLQGTYGPTQTSLSEAMSYPNAAAWIQAQMQMDPTLLRAHYRQRANAYTKNDLHHHGTRLACEQGSRWNRYAFNRWRDVGKSIVEEASGTGTGSWLLKIDGITRTEVVKKPSVQFSLSSTSYVICRNDAMSSFVQGPTKKGKLYVATTSDACMTSMTAIDMPAVYFSSQGTIPTVNLVNMSDPNIIDAKILQNLVSPSTCDNFKLTWPNFVKDNASGLYYVEDRRVELYKNTDGVTTEKKRLLDGKCPQVPKTFLNEGTCRIRSDCSPPRFNGDFALNAANLRKFYELDGKYVYRIQNLPLIDTPSPCASWNTRFVRKNASGDGTGCTNNKSTAFSSIATAIKAHLSSLSASDQASKRVIDLKEMSLGCTDASNAALGGTFTVTIPSTNTLSCWTHTYEYEWSVFVMNDWAVNHPGNARYFRESRANPIAAVAENKPTANPEDSVTLSFPPWVFHTYNFHNNRWRFEKDLVGSWGDRVSFDELPDSAKSVNAITKGLNGTIIANSGDLVEVCGSPGEVSNDPSKGHQYLLQKYGDAEEEFAATLDQDHERWVASKMIWNTVTMNAPDQLRHRVAWALASIFIVSERSIDLEGVSEPWGAYYDIFVRHAFGSSFFELLREVAFSPLMALMLTFESSKSLAYQVERNGVTLYPDENFAREIMQLFSIGLFMLNQDGSHKIDPATGVSIPTYTNEDIMNFSRGWTNFHIREDERDNIEPEWSHEWVTNKVDPMTIPTSEGRDVFPKQTLLVDGKRGYIGDQVPRCDALPNKPWLRKGAVWEFREDSQSLLGKQDPDWWAEPETWSPRMVLNPTTSNLYKKLCNRNLLTGKCEFRSTVVLDADVACDGTCTAGQNTWDSTANPTLPCECSIDEPRTVRLDHSPTMSPIWYEYKRAPCVQLAFPEAGNMNTVKEIGADYGNKALCADSRFAVAGTTCCDAGGSPINICVFKGERTTYKTAADRCSKYGFGYSTCSWSTVEINWDCGTDTSYGQGDWSIQSSPGMRFSWTNDSCSMKAQIDINGNVAIIHSVQSNTVKERVAVDKGTYFGVFWSSGSYPQAASSCGGIAGCQLHDNTCICSTSVQTTVAFDGSQVPSATDVFLSLYIGATDPNQFDAGYYNLCTAPICSVSGLKIYSRKAVSSNINVANAFDIETIFEVTHPLTGEKLYLSNSKSTVSVGGGTSFRNPPMYNSPIDPTQRDGLYETDAILQGYVSHPNTAPFIATKIIQSLVTSNPSPRFVKVAADAFRTGSFSSDGIAFGSGKYGDMEAMVAAIMLDREARSAILDDDTNHGRSREPLLKIMHMFRSMELSTASGAKREISMMYLLDRGLGQEAFKAPSVFGFFLNEYQPIGPVHNKGLYAPETQLFDTPKLLSFINGLFSLPDYGLSDCEWWQGFGDDKSRYIMPDYPDGGRFDCGFADVPLTLRWKPPSWGGQTNVNGASVSSIINDIDLLLTGGRLHSANKVILTQVYNGARTGGNPDNKALRAVLKHYSAVPEFHITNNLLSSSATTSARPIPNITMPQSPPPVVGYKAIVYLFMSGASDSFSMLAPTAGCVPLHSQYLSERGDVAIPSANLLPIDTSTSNQPCNSFGIHSSLLNIRNLYASGDASWVANIGPLVTPLNKTEFEAGSKPVPISLFAHNIQTVLTQTVFAQDASAGGVLGRIGDALNTQSGKEIFHGYSISGTPKILEGSPGVSRPADILSGWGVSSFNYLVEPYESNIEALSSKVASSIHGETFSAAMTNSLYRTRLLGDVIGQTEVTNAACFNALDTDIASQLHQVARLMKNRDGLVALRDVFYTDIGGFDTHSDNGPELTALLKQIDDAIGCFKTEMIGSNIWNNVTIVSASEFGRTLTSNGLGTDHAWGGNHFILGGSVRGGKIHGKYPDDLTDNGKLNIGRGRLIPSTPWEGVWNGIAEWFGVNATNRNSILPNKNNFATNIFSQADLFE